MQCGRPFGLQRRCARKRSKHNIILLAGIFLHRWLTITSFVDDIPRWASLLRSDDQRLFKEIASLLWGTPSSGNAQEDSKTFKLDETLNFLQELVSNLVETSGLFDRGSGGSCGSYRLQSLRHKYLSVRHHHDTREERLSLAEWCPLPPLEAERSLHSDAPKPPDPRRKLSVLDRITVLMAGAIFGAIFLYLCRRFSTRYTSIAAQTNTVAVSQCGFSIPSQLVSSPENDQRWASTHIVARNCIVLALYIGVPSRVDFGWKSTDYSLLKPIPPSPVVPGSTPAETFQEHMRPVQPSYDDDCSMVDSSR